MATSGASSTLSLTILILPTCSAAISWRMGAIILHGPHHSAQKSTRTGSDVDATTSSKVEADSVLIDAAMADSLVLVSERSNVVDPPRIPADVRQCCVSSHRSASMAAMQPEPAAVTA